MNENIKANRLDIVFVKLCAITLYLRNYYFIPDAVFTMMLPCNDNGGKSGFYDKKVFLNSRIFHSRD